MKRVYLRKIKRKIKILLGYVADFKRYVNYSLDSSVYGESDYYLGLIIRLYHTIEKGMSTEPIEPGFGVDNISWLLSVMAMYPGSKDDTHLLSAVKTLQDYFDYHASINFSSPKFDELKNQFGVISNYYSHIRVHGGTKVVEEESSHCRLEFSDFLKSRVSVRFFDEEKKIETEDILQAISVAKACPSACNRHAIKIFYSLDNEKIRKILTFQNGSKSFRDKVPGLFIITSDLRYQEGVEERNLGYIEGGIWIMSLVTALRLQGLSSCVLNWCVAPQIDDSLRRELEIKNHYQIVAMIAFGYSKKSQKVPYSIRKNDESFLEMI